jgi:hypothetical protein
MKKSSQHMTEKITSKLKHKIKLVPSDISGDNFLPFDKRTTINYFLSNTAVKLHFYKLLFPTAFVKYESRNSKEEGEDAPNLEEPFDSNLKSVY